MKRILESKAKLPDWASLSKLGDFRILTDDTEDELELRAPKNSAPGHCQAEQSVDSGIQMSNTAVHPAEYNTYEGHRDNGLEHPFNSFGLEEGSRSYDKIPQHLKDSHLVAGEYHQGGKHSPLPPPPPPPPPPPSSPLTRRVTRKQLPGPDLTPPMSPHGTSMNYVNGLRVSKSRRESSSHRSAASSYLEERRHDSPTLGNYPTTSRSSGSPTPSSQIDSMQYGVPPLQTPRLRDGSSPWMSSSLKRDYHPNKPLPQINTDPPPFSPSSLSQMGHTPSHHREASHSGHLPRGGYLSPVSPTAFMLTRGSSGNEQVDYGVRPGETEIMKDEFKNM
jgi:hypothetical protein